MGRHTLLGTILACLGCSLHSFEDSCSSQASKPIAGPLVPQRVDVGESGWSKALEVLLDDGAVVLKGLPNFSVENADSFRDLAAVLPTHLFAAGNDTSSARGLKLLSPNAPVNAVHEELRDAKKRGLYLPGSGLEPHTDGYVYGDDMPDFVFLVCEQPSSLGGGNVLLDGHTLLEALREGDSEDRELAAWLAATPVDLSEPAETGIAQGRLAAGPILQWHPTSTGVKRFKWRRQIDTAQTQRLSTWKPMVSSPQDVAAQRCANLSDLTYLSLWRPLSSADPLAVPEVESKLQAFDAVIQQASAVAYAEHSFMLFRGEALVVDNYRVLHGRAPYRAPLLEKLANDGSPGLADAEAERRFWRVWSWTSAGTGLPPDGARTSNPLNDDVFQARGKMELKAEL